MEFSSRGFQRGTTRPATTATGSGANSGDLKGPDKPVHKKAIHKIKSNRPLSILGGVLFISAVILVVAVLLGISTKSSESSIVDKDQYQAVFLNGGQAYFGKISTLNERYIDINDIYYISTNGQSNSDSQANISLVKLGSELHCPQDRMVINRDQVLFWENLNDDGKVVNAIKQWQKENPNGQKCNNQTTQQQTPVQSSTGSENNSSSTDRNSDSSASQQSSNGATSNQGNTTSQTNDTPTSSNPNSSTGNGSTGTTPPATP